MTLEAATVVTTYGGREWESNPPETVSLPHPDLKSGRPTRDDSPPSVQIQPSKQIQSMFVDTALVTMAQGHSVPIEKFEDLDSDLAAIG